MRDGKSLKILSNIRFVKRAPYPQCQSNFRGGLITRDPDPSFCFETKFVPGGFRSENEI